MSNRENDKHKEAIKHANACYRCRDIREKIFSEGEKSALQFLVKKFAQLLGVDTEQ